MEGAQRAKPAGLDEAALLRLNQLRAAGLTAREATAQLSKELRLPRRQVYDAWLRLQNSEGSAKPLC
jgi:hypothetical protein